MLTQNFGFEIEFTGITKNQAATIISNFLGGRIDRVYGSYDTYKITAPDNRVWKIMNDASIRTERKENGIRTRIGNDYSVELVSPILTYENDMETLQEIIRLLRQGGAFTNETCGIHLHLDGAPHTPRSIKNFINIIASKNDLFYDSLKIKPARMHYCKKMDSVLVTEMNRKKPTTMQQIENIWYEGYYQTRNQHYHESRYHFLNLHSFWQGNRTVELRGFNAELHAGKVRAYVILALALNRQALTQRCASSKKPQIENPKFAMRTYLNRIGLKGENFKNCREHLCKHLNGDTTNRFFQMAA